MMLGDSSSVPGSSGGVLAAATTFQEAAEAAGRVIGSNSGEDDKSRGEDGERSFLGGNRWPRQETLALLKIRSDMDAEFRDSSHKGPLWEEISRKMGELGYNRSGKKCKEKFENVYKYHRRTKDGRTGKSDGKTYRFFDQLEAFENVHNSASPPKPQTPLQTTSPTMPWTTATNNNNSLNFPPTPINSTQNFPSNQTASFSQPSNNATSVPMNPYPITTISNNPSSTNFQTVSSNPHFSTSTSSSTASEDHEEQEGSNGSKKRKWKVFFRRLTKKVIDRQEKLQKQFLQTIERHENERVAREEAWRSQEMARIDREHDILIQERSKAAAKDAAVVAFLQKISGPGQTPPPQPNVTVQAAQVLPPENNSTPPPPRPPAPANDTMPQAPTLLPPHPAVNFDAPKMSNGENYTNVLAPSPSRWPKAEVQALIHLRTNLENKYQDNGPKAPLWEEISAAMRRLGYNRSAKRCKEKWENINKYFKKVKESNKKRPGDSKTCPYFEQLDAIYREKSRITMAVAPLMVQPEQQWPPEAEMGTGNVVNEDEDDGESDEDEDGFEIVASKAAQVGAAE